VRLNLVALDATHRCDRCDAQAYVAVAVMMLDSPDKAGELPLLFCAHHWREHRPKVLLSGARILVDNTAALIQQEAA
jgi:hypothetical protein